MVITDNKKIGVLITTDNKKSGVLIIIKKKMHVCGMQSVVIYFLQCGYIIYEMSIIMLFIYLNDEIFHMLDLILVWGGVVVYQWRGRGRAVVHQP